MGERARISWSVADLLKATGGELLGGGADRRFAGVTTDSRHARADECFVAIIGGTHDGHRFADDALRRGARGVILSADQAGALPHRQWAENRGAVCIAVSDTTRALGALAAYHRRRAGVPVVAITGSNGKTTTRRMTAAVLSSRFRTLASRGNFNNEIGLPLTLLRLTRDHERAVVELGMNHPGEIARLTTICEPQIGVITNIGPAHLEGVGTLDGVMRAKGELLQNLGAGAKAVLNADDGRVMRLAQEAACEVLRFGFAAAAQIRALDVHARASGTRFTLSTPEGRVPVRLTLPGRFMVANALAAAGTGFLLGIGIDAIKDALETVAPRAGRMHTVTTASGVRIIDDTYNANPASMKAAIEALGTLKGSGRGFLVVGDMRELGEQAAALHAQIGELAAQADLSAIFACGHYARHVLDAARQAGMAADRLFAGSRGDIAAELPHRLRSGDWVLVKGSRAMAMEKIVAALVSAGKAPRKAGAPGGKVK